MWCGGFLLPFDTQGCIVNHAVRLFLLRAPGAIHCRVQLDGRQLQGLL